MQGKVKNCKDGNKVLRNKVEICKEENRVLKSIIHIHGLYELTELGSIVQVKIRIPVQACITYHGDIPSGVDQM